MNGNVVVAHSVLTDPAFAKMSELKHAGGCEKTSCHYPNCAETKSLLEHVEQCSQEQCEFNDCAFARLLLDHSNGLHRNMLLCPLCRKQAILKRLHPGKAPRSSGSEEDEDEEEESKKKKDEEDDEMDGGLSKARKIARRMTMFPAARRNLRPLSVPRQPPKRAFMIELRHSNMCQKNPCTEPHCAHSKSVLCHVRQCPFFENCYYPGCVVARELVNHIRACDPVIRQCPICDKQAPPMYTGDDALSSMPALVLRTIFRKMNILTRDLRPLTQVNRRFREFLRDEKELRGIGEKEKFDRLTIEQVGDCAVCFHFSYKEDMNGHFYVLSTVGASVDETIYYDAKKSDAAKNYIDAKYPRCSDTSPAVRIPLEFYDELFLAMLKNDFIGFELRNIILDFDFFDFFISKMNDIYPMKRKIRVKNIRIEPSDQLTKSVSEDFEAVLDIRSVKHLCKEEHKERIEKKKKEAEKKAKAAAKLRKKNKKKGGDVDKAGTSSASRNENNREGGEEEKAGTNSKVNTNEGGNEEKAGISNEIKVEKETENGDEKEDVFPCGCDLQGFFACEQEFPEEEWKKQF